MAGNYRGFRHGQKVTHLRWTDQAGEPLTGTVWVFALSTEEQAQGCAEAEVRWHDAPPSDAPAPTAARPIDPGFRVPARARPWRL